MKTSKRTGNMLHGDNPRTIRTIEQRSKFLETLAETCNITRSCQAAGLGRSAVYAWRRDDVGFDADWKDALEIAGDALQDEAVRRAVEGVDRPVFQGGEKVGVVRDYSDTLLVLLLKGAKPEQYRERQEVKHGGHMMFTTLTDEQKLQKIEELFHRVKARKDGEVSE